MLKDSNKIIYEFISGSHSYGLNTPQSDVDIRGIFHKPISELLSIKPVSPDPISDSTNDTTYYSVKRFFELAKDVNPNICEFLYIPKEFVKICHPIMQKIIDNRQLFISKKAKFTFSGYAYQQVSKAKGENKWINNPKPEAKPKREDYCWVIPNSTMPQFNGKEIMPFRPIPLKKWKEIIGYGLEKCNCSSVEHTSNQFRLYYDSSDNCKGVFREGNIVTFHANNTASLQTDGGIVSTISTESISMEMERTLFVGTLIYNENAYNSEKRDWKNYWDWKKNRNEARWIQQEKGEMDFDCKNMLHCIRILKSCVNIFKNGEPIIQWHGKEKEFLMDIRNGKFEFDYIMKLSEDLKNEIEELYITSTIPHSCDIDKLNEFYLETIYELDKVI